MTTIIRARAAHDFLALIPTLVGYRPSRSLLCVAFEGNRTAGVFRHDLPRGERARDSLVEALVGTLCRMVHVDAVVPIAYTEARFGDGGLPERALLEGVVCRAEEAGFLVRDALSVGADGWGSLLDEELPPGGRSLELVESSPLTRHPEALRDPAESAAALVRIPESDPALAGRIDEVLASLRTPAPEDGVAEGDDRTPGAPVPDALLELDDVIGDALDPLVAAELLARGTAGRAPELLAWLVHLAACPVFRDAMMLQVAFGPVIGELALDAGEDAHRLHAAPADPVGESGEGGDPDEGGESTEAFLSRLLLGHANVRPDVERIERALETLVVAIANAPAPERAGALCVAAWLAWALGRGSSAGALIDAALEADPELSMAGLLHRFIGSGAMPEWAFSPAIPSEAGRVR